MTNQPITCAEAGRRGGLAKSKAKTIACRLNGKRGGWPKGRPRKPASPILPPAPQQTV